MRQVEINLAIIAIAKLTSINLSLEFTQSQLILYIYMSEDLPDLFFLLAGAASAALVFTIYHVSIRCNRSIPSTPTPNSEPQQPDRLSTAAEYVEMMTAVTSKYEKDMGFVGDDDRMCVVCLGEYEEGEELRTLPHCMHSFHAPCVDTWLLSHINCPLCRSPLSLFISERHQDF